MDRCAELRYLVLGAQREGGRVLAAALRPHGLTPAQAEVVEVLASVGRPLSVKEIGSRLVCEQGSPSRLLATVAKKGLTRVVPDATDGRRTVVELTAAGRAAAESGAAVKAMIDAAIAAALTPQEIDTAVRLLRALVGELPAVRALDLRIADA